MEEVNSKFKKKDDFFFYIVLECFFGKFKEKEQVLSSIGNCAQSSLIFESCASGLWILTQFLNLERKVVAQNSNFVCLENNLISSLCKNEEWIGALLVTNLSNNKLYSRKNEILNLYQRGISDNSSIQKIIPILSKFQISEKEFLLENANMYISKGNVAEAVKILCGLREPNKAFDLLLSKFKLDLISDQYETYFSLFKDVIEIEISNPEQEMHKFGAANPKKEFAFFANFIYFVDIIENLPYNSQFSPLLSSRLNTHFGYMIEALKHIEIESEEDTMFYSFALKMVLERGLKYNSKFKGSPNFVPAPNVILFFIYRVLLCWR